MLLVNEILADNLINSLPDVFYKDDDCSPDEVKFRFDSIRIEQVNDRIRMVHIYKGQDIHEQFADADFANGDTVTISLFAENYGMITMMF